MPKHIRSDTGAEMTAKIDAAGLQSAERNAPHLNPDAPTSVALHKSSAGKHLDLLLPHKRGKTISIISAILPRIIDWPSPVEPWEQLKIGGGTPPIKIRHGWLIVYHGVQKNTEPGTSIGKLCYSAGIMVLSETRPNFIFYRAADTVLEPASAQEPRGTGDNVVFPTGIDRRDDLGTPDRIDIYYGMADSSIGAARLIVPQNLKRRSIADAPSKSESGLHAET